MDSKGRIAVCDTMNFRVQLFDAQGTFLNSITTMPPPYEEYSTPRSHAVAFDSNDLLYVSTQSPGPFVRVYDGTTLVRTLPSPLKKTQHVSPRGICVDAAGHVLVSDFNRGEIFILDGDGVLLGRFGKRGKADGQFECPMALSVDPHGRILICDVNHHQIQIFA